MIQGSKRNPVIVYAVLPDIHSKVVAGVAKTGKHILAVWARLGFSQCLMHFEPVYFLNKRPILVFHTLDQSTALRALQQGFKHSC